MLTQLNHHSVKKLNNLDDFSLELLQACNYEGLKSQLDSLQADRQAKAIKTIYDVCKEIKKQGQSDRVEDENDACTLRRRAAPGAPGPALDSHGDVTYVSAPVVNHIRPAIGHINPALGGIAHGNGCIGLPVSPIRPVFRPAQREIPRGSLADYL
jgi:hypothetical protein